MAVGIVSSHGFGDIVLNLPLIKTISDRTSDDVWVAAQPQCLDALYNIPWITKIVPINDMWQGVEHLKTLGCNPVYQITQNVKFFEFRERDQNHSLIDTPFLTGRELGIKDFDQRPIFRPTAKEEVAKNRLPNDRFVAIENVYKSAQSWAMSEHFDYIISRQSSRILWLSNSTPPADCAVIDCKSFSRRELIMCLQQCDTFYSVGSGFFCATLALPKKWQPKRIVCLWVDDMYKYESRLNELQWHDNIVWVHNAKELHAIV